MKVIILCIVSLSMTLFAQSYHEVEKIKMDNIKSDKSKESMQKWLAGNFALQTYKVNYLLPYGQANKKYDSGVPDVQYSDKEAELQVSLKLQVAHNLLGLKEKYYVSYTHQAFWQIYTQSSPFRESMYNPEGFVVFPISDNESMFQLRSLKFAIAHRSNGQPNTSDVTFSNGQVLGNKSRSVNYIYSTLRLQHKTLITDLTLWLPYRSANNLSDNPDLMDYTGYSSIKFTYFYDEHMFTLMGRGNIRTGNGAVEATYSYPLMHDINLYAKIFSGYTESLIDYNHYITKFSIGFSFSR